MLYNDYSDVITMDELCKILEIEKNTAYRLLKNHEIHAFKISRIWKIPRKAVNDYVIQKTNLKNSL